MDRPSDDLIPSHINRKWVSGRGRDGNFDEKEQSDAHSQEDKSECDHRSRCRFTQFVTQMQRVRPRVYKAARLASFFFGVYSWLVKVLGQFSIIYFRRLGLRIGVRVWVRVRVGVRVWVGVRVRFRVRVSVVLWSG